MTPDTAPLTVIQHPDNDEYRALLARFWQPAPVRSTCDVCGDWYVVTSASGVSRYCSDDCRREGRYRLERADRERHKHLGAAIKRLKAERRAA